MLEAVRLYGDLQPSVDQIRPHQPAPRRPDLDLRYEMQTGHIQPDRPQDGPERVGRPRVGSLDHPQHVLTIMTSERVMGLDLSAWVTDPCRKAESATASAAPNESHLAQSNTVWTGEVTKADPTRP